MVGSSAWRAADEPCFLPRTLKSWEWARYSTSARTWLSALENAERHGTGGIRRGILEKRKESESLRKV
jgi:hypothetical protein